MSAPASSAPFRVLIVGAGAVGQIYGHHLAQGGAAVTFYVRERYRDETSRGFTILPLARRGHAERFEGFDVVCSPAELAGRSFDQVYLAIPSTGLAAPWLRQLIAAIGLSALVVNLAPSAGDREKILATGMSPARLVDGFISIVSYASPLPGSESNASSAPAGTAVWYPPGAPSLFSGARAPDVIAALRAGHLPARRHRDVAAHNAFLSSAFMPYLLALEAAGWSLAELRRTRFALATDAARQAMRITAASFGTPPLGLRLNLAMTSPIRLALALAPRFAPFPLEAYLRYHFTKVGAQTRHIVADTIARGRVAERPTSALEELLATVPAAS